MSIKTFIITICSVVLVLVGTAVGIYQFYLTPKYIAPYSVLEAKLATYETVYGTVGDFITAYVINEKQHYGSEITIEQFSEIQVPAVLSSYVTTNIYDVVSNEESQKYWMVDVEPNQFMTANLCQLYQQEDTQRAFQVNLDFLPVGLETGELVDIRLSLPTGQDYIVLSQRHLNAIYGNKLIDLVLDEYDIALWNSVMVDKSLYPGVLVYATKYVSGNQDSSQMFYPMNRAVLDALVSDPNVRPDLHIVENYDKLLANRVILDNLMSSTKLSTTFVENATIGRSTWASSVEAGQQEYLRQQDMAAGGY